MSVRLLGPLEVLAGGQRKSLAGSRQKKLLAVLLLNANNVVTIPQLVDALWEERPPDTAHRQVLNAIAALRRQLGTARAIVVTDGPGYRAQLAEEQVDAFRFGRAVDTARREAAAGDRNSAIQTISAALRLWRGPCLAGLTGRVIENAAFRFDEQRLTAWELVMDLRLEEGESGSLIPELTELGSQYPLRERFSRQLITAMYRCGRQPEALRVYEQTRAMLADELGLDPGPELRALHQQVLRNESVVASPNRLHTAATGEDATTTEDRPGWLPRDVADFIGREAETNKLLAAASSTTDTAVITMALDGMAGVGKTALAVRVAHLLASEYPDGQLFIDLHGHSPTRRPLAPGETLEVLLRGVGVAPEQVPDGLTLRVGKWRSMLAGKRVMVVLDNVSDTEQIRALLPGAPGACVVVTSRRRLSMLEGAVTVSLDLMPGPDAGALFRAVAGREPAAEQVDELVALCGFLPLAVRIAATRLRSRPAWTVRDLTERLQDEKRLLLELSMGDRAITDALAGSYCQLSSRHRRLFRLLGLLPQEQFDAYRIAALAGSPVDETERMLEDLLDLNIITQHTAGRYELHVLLRQYARVMAEQEGTEP